ncbi:MAG: hypothetical protein DDT19_02469 [Syntrophomonadaceae bacterium]|nr:hypothetical protein [Bacillota bacterium]
MICEKRKANIPDTAKFWTEKMGTGIFFVGPPAPSTPNTKEKKVGIFPERDS